MQEISDIDSMKANRNRDPAAIDGMEPIDRTLNRESHVVAFVIACFFLSGMAALLYETVWLRQFSILLGTTDQSLAVTLSSYMLGLAIGSWIGARVKHRIRNPMRVYGLLELGIAITAVLVPVATGVMQSLQTWFFTRAEHVIEAGDPAYLLFGFVCVFCIVVLPTAMMGATLPILAGYVVRCNAHLGQRVAWLYASNTCGAVVGVALGAFVLLPSFGLWPTTLIGAAINITVFLLVVLLRKRFSFSVKGNQNLDLELERFENEDTSLPKESNIIVRRAAVILPLIAISGALSFGYEIVFTRMLGHLLGASVFAFASMLAAFLIGISLGSAIASSLARDRLSAAKGFVVAQIATSLSVLLAFYSLDALASLDNVASSAFRQTLRPTTLLSVSVLLLPTTFIGMTFPFAIRVLCQSTADAERSSGNVYCWNTLGGVLGALIMGHFILPTFGYNGAILLSSLAGLSLAFAGLLVIPKRRKLIVSILTALILVVIIRPGRPDAILRTTGLPNLPAARGNLVFAETGRSATVTLYEALNGFTLYTSGLPESVSSRRGYPLPTTSPATWLGVLPTITKSNVESIALIGLGGGVTAQWIPPSVDAIDVFELEPAVIRANQWMDQFRDPKVMSDPRSQVLINDGRNGLLLTDKKYDAIVSQPSHPWTSGGSHLFTKEFLEIIKLRLKVDGVFVQWMNLEFVDRPLFGMLASGLLSEFEHVRLYQFNETGVAFVASNVEYRPESSWLDLSESSYSPADIQWFSKIGLSSLEDIMAMFALDCGTLQREFASSPVVTDNWNAIAMDSPRVVSNRRRNTLTKWITNHGPLFDEEFRQENPWVDDLDEAFLARKSWRIRRHALSTRLSDQVKSKGTIDWGSQAGLQPIKTFKRLHDQLNSGVLDDRGAFVLAKLNVLYPDLELPKESVSKVLSQLSASRRALIDTMGNSQLNMSELLKRDDAIGKIEPDDHLYRDALLFRVGWRMQTRRQEMARDAFHIVASAEPYLDPKETIGLRIVTSANGEMWPTALVSSEWFANHLKLLKRKSQSDSLARLQSVVQQAKQVCQMIDRELPDQRDRCNRVQRVLDSYPELNEQQ